MKIEQYPYIKDLGLADTLADEDTIIIGKMVMVGGEPRYFAKAVKAVDFKNEMLELTIDGADLASFVKAATEQALKAEKCAYSAEDDATKAGESEKAAEESKKAAASAASAASLNAESVAASRVHIDQVHESVNQSVTAVNQAEIVAVESADIASRLVGSVLISGGYFTPTIEIPYPDISEQLQSTLYRIKMIQVSDSFVYTTGGLKGEAVRHDDTLYWHKPTGEFTLSKAVSPVVQGGIEVQPFVFTDAKGTAFFEHKVKAYSYLEVILNGKELDITDDYTINAKGVTLTPVLQQHTDTLKLKYFTITSGAVGGVDPSQYLGVGIPSVADPDPLKPEETGNVTTTIEALNHCFTFANSGKAVIIDAGLAVGLPFEHGMTFAEIAGVFERIDGFTLLTIARSGGITTTLNVNSSSGDATAINVSNVAVNTAIALSGKTTLTIIGSTSNAGTEQNAE